MRFLSEYSLWYVLLCGLVGLTTAYVLYRKDDKLSEAPILIKRLLFGIRSVVVFMLCFLLLGVYLNISSKQIEKPIIVVLQDNSESLLLNKDREYYETEYPVQIQNIIKYLQDLYEVKIVYFGAEPSLTDSLNFAHKETNISKVFEGVNNKFSESNVGAIILASDGIYTSGVNPKYTYNSLPLLTPVYSIALGDTIQAKDLLISKIEHNKIAFRNSSFPVKIHIEAYGLQNKISKLIVKDEDGKELINKNISISSKEAFFTESLQITTQKIGKQIYSVSLVPIDGEISAKNNNKSFIVDVLESKQRILLTYKYLHPDIGAVKKALEQNENFEVIENNIVDENQSVEDYNSIIYFGLPTNQKEGGKHIAEAIKYKIPAMFVCNGSTDYKSLPLYNTNLNIQNTNAQTEEVQAWFNPDFSLFTLSNETKELLESVPPLTVPYGRYSSTNSNEVCLYQNFESVKLNKPLVAVNSFEGHKTATIFGEGIWRWKVQDLVAHDNSELFDGFIQKIVSYISIKQKKSKFHINSKEVFYENEDIVIESELYNESYEPIVNKKVTLKTIDSLGTEMDYIFNRNNNSYITNLGKYKPGKYSIIATYDNNSETQSQKGLFFVEPIKKEYLETKANHSLLRTISQKTGGELFFPQTMDSLVEAISNNKNISAISKITQKERNILNYLVLLIVLVLLLGTEWFLRKFYGHT